MESNVYKHQHPCLCRYNYHPIEVSSIRLLFVGRLGCYMISFLIERGMLVLRRERRLRRFVVGSVYRYHIPWYSYSRMTSWKQHNLVEWHMPGYYTIGIESD